MIVVRAWSTSTEHLSPSHTRKLRGVYLFLNSAATPAFLFRWLFASSLARQRFRTGNRLARLLRKLREYHVVRIAQQPREFPRRQSVPGLQRHPLRPRQVRRRNNVGPLREFRKIFRRCFERQTNRSGLQRRHRKHLPAHLEYQVVAPLILFRRAREGKT